MTRGRPRVIAAGLFSGRHRTLYEALAKRADVQLFTASGDWPGAPVFPLQPAPPPSQDVVNDLAGRLQRLLATADPRRNHEPDPDWLNHLLNLWAHGRSITHSLKQQHADDPVTAVVSVNDHLAPNRALVSSARGLGIPTYFLDHGHSIANNDGTALKRPADIVRPSCDILCVESPLAAAYWSTMWTDDDRPRIEVIGTVLDATPPPVDNSRRALLFCPGWVEATFTRECLLGDYYEHETFTRFCRTVVALRDEFPDHEIVVKIHPTLSRTIGVDTSAYFRETAQTQGLGDITVDDTPISDWLPRADLLVTSRLSSVNFEALLEGVPTITLLSPLRSALLKTPAGQSTILGRQGLHDIIDESVDLTALARDRLAQKQDGRFVRQVDDTLHNTGGPDNPGEQLCDLVFNDLE